MSIPIITVCSHPEYAQTLIQTAQKQGFDVIVLKVDWRGFGTKIINVYEYLKQHPEIESFFFADAFDVVVMRKYSPIYLEDFMVFSAEKGCWPDGNLASSYPETASQFKYLNSGLYFAPTKKWMEMVEENPVDYADDDQLYFTKCFLSSNYDIALDDYQTKFNSHSFIADDDYIYSETEGLLVRINGSVVLQRPFMVHSNGKTIDPKLDELVRRMLE